MDFDLTKEQEMIRKEVRKFAQSEIAPVAVDLDETETFSVELTRKIGEIGLFGMFVSEAYEGQAMDYISYIIAVEEIARVDGSQAATIAAGNQDADQCQQRSRLRDGRTRPVDPHSPPASSCPDWAAQPGTQGPFGHVHKWP